MTHNPYGRFRGQRLSLSDYLAIDRTVLANERTLLSYGRTALALAVVGGTCIKFFQSPVLQLLGLALVLSGAVIAIRGWRRFFHTRRLLAAALEQETGAPEHPLTDEVNPPKDTPARSEESPVAPRST